MTGKPVSVNELVDVAWLNAGVISVYNTTLGIASASIDTGAILPTTYACLRVVLQARGDTAATSVDVRMRCNNDSAANYGSQYERGIAAVASAAESVSATSALVGTVAAASATANHAGVVEILIPNYGSTVFFKNWSAYGGWSQAITTSNIAAQTTSGVWISTAAINQITLLPSAGNFITGSRMTVYVMGS